MKLNIIKVLNNIAAEEATVVMLNDPEAVWNLPNNEEELRDDYNYYKVGVEMENDGAWDLIEHCEKYGWDYSHVKIEKVMTFDEWLEKRNEMMSKYLVAA